MSHPTAREGNILFVIWKVSWEVGLKTYNTQKPFNTFRDRVLSHWTEWLLLCPLCSLTLDTTFHTYAQGPAERTLRAPSHGKASSVSRLGAGRRTVLDRARNGDL